jgi:heptosyltransferase-3
MKILIIKFRNIGDVLLTIPLAGNLRKHYPEAIVDFAVNEGTEEMVSLNPDIRHIHVYKRNLTKSKHLLARLLDEWRYANGIRKEKYDIIINMTRGNRGLFLAAYGKPRTIISYSTKKSRWLNKFIDIELPAMGFRHMVEVSLDPLRVLGKIPLEKTVKLYWSVSDEKRVVKILEKHGLAKKGFVHFHPVSRWMFKCIDDSLAASIVDHCQMVLGIPVVITASPDEKEKDKVERILALCESSPIDLSGKLTLKETSAMNAMSKAFIGVDTAIMHISAANDIPTLAFFGPSAAFHWGPWDNSLYRSTYTKTRGNQRMGKHQVVQKNWECVPCGKDGCEGSKKSDCLLYLSIRECTILVENFLEESR